MAPRFDFRLLSHFSCCELSYYFFVPKVQYSSSAFYSKGGVVAARGARACLVLICYVLADTTDDNTACGRCKIGDEGARCLADALRSNSSLRELR